MKVGYTDDLDRRMDEHKKAAVVYDLELVWSVVIANHVRCETLLKEDLESRQAIREIFFYDDFVESTFHDLPEGVDDLFRRSLDSSVERAKTYAAAFAGEWPPVNDLVCGYIKRGDYKGIKDTFPC